MRSIITLCLALAMLGCSSRPSNSLKTVKNSGGKDMEDFKNNFVGHGIPSDLIELYEFDHKSKEEYSRGFELSNLSEKWMLRSYSEDSLFLSSLIEFAQANHSGSHYAIWTADNRNLNTAPIVIFGDEGGYHVIAENVRQLLHILSCDVEPIVSWDRVVYSKSSQDKASPRKIEFHDWLKKKFEIKPADDADSITKMAQAMQSEKFANWMKQYVR